MSKEGIFLATSSDRYYPDNTMYYVPTDDQQSNENNDLVPLFRSRRSGLHVHERFFFLALTQSIDLHQPQWQKDTLLSRCCRKDKQDDTASTSRFKFPVCEFN
ncbi:hypothetical protein CBL_11561 [Carabus blaptoides fortunei]